MAREEDLDGAPKNLLDAVHVLEPEVLAPSADEAKLLAMLRANTARVRELLAAN